MSTSKKGSLTLHGMDLRNFSTENDDSLTRHEIEVYKWWLAICQSAKVHERWNIFHVLGRDHLSQNQKLDDFPKKDVREVYITLFQTAPKIFICKYI